MLNEKMGYYKVQILNSTIKIAQNKCLFTLNLTSF